jgi:uncharacterized protein
MKTKPTPFVETLALDSTTLNDDETKMRLTSDGYLVCRPRIARTGIQLYRGEEVGRPDMKEVRVYRPESEVFSIDAIKSLAGKPLTVEHPDEPVTSKNWRELSVGYVGNEVMRDGEFIRIPLHLMDAQAIEEVKSGKTQLSVGYSAVLDWKDGQTSSGEPYHVTQTAIRANHVAITHTARGGPLLRMGDKQEREMATRTITVDGLPVTLEDRDAQIVEKQITKLTTDLSAAQTALATAQTTAQNDTATSATALANAKTEVQTKDAEIATLKQQLTEAKMSPQKLDQMVSARVACVQRAKDIIGDSVVVEGKSDADIRRQVVSAKLGETAKDWSDDMITASFNTLTVAIGDTGNGLQHVVDVVRHNDSNFGDARAKAYTEYETGLQNRWKTAGVRNSA